MQMMKNKAKIGLSVFIIFVVAAYLGYTVSNKPFDSTKWKNWKESEESYSGRYEMINSLKAGNRLIGKTKSEIIDLLGKPEMSYDSIFVYYLGYAKRGINTANLEVNFNKDNLVNKLEVTEH